MRHRIPPLYRALGPAPFTPEHFLRQLTSSPPSVCSWSPWAAAGSPPCSSAPGSGWQCASATDAGSYSIHACTRTHTHTHPPRKQQFIIQMTWPSISKFNSWAAAAADRSAVSTGWSILESISPGIREPHRQTSIKSITCWQMRSHIEHRIQFARGKKINK